jgi:hypothetical protein
MQSKATPARGALFGAREEKDGNLISSPNTPRFRSGAGTYSCLGDWLRLIRRFQP